MKISLRNLTYYKYGIIYYSAQYEVLKPRKQFKFDLCIPTRTQSIYGQFKFKLDLYMAYFSLNLIYIWPISV